MRLMGSWSSSSCINNLLKGVVQPSVNPSSGVLYTATLTPMCRLKGDACSLVSVLAGAASLAPTASVVAAVVEMAAAVAPVRLAAAAVAVAVGLLLLLGLVAVLAAVDVVLLVVVVVVVACKAAVVAAVRPRWSAKLVLLNVQDSLQTCSVLSGVLHSMHHSRQTGQAINKWVRVGGA